MWSCSEAVFWALVCFGVLSTIATVIVYAMLVAASMADYWTEGD